MLAIEIIAILGTALFSVSAGMDAGLRVTMNRKGVEDPSAWLAVMCLAVAIVAACLI